MSEANPVLDLPMHEGAGSVCKDRSGNNLHGAMSGASWVQLPSGLWVLDFPENVGEVNCGNPAELNDWPAFTYELWGYLGLSVYPAGNHRTLISKGSKWFEIEGDGRLKGSIMAATNNAISYAEYENPSLLLYRWHHYVMTYDDNGDRKVRLYLGGAEVEYFMQGAAQGDVAADATFDFRVARYAVALPWDWDGYFSQVRIYDHVLTAEEVAKRYAAGLPGAKNPHIYLFWDESVESNFVSYEVWRRKKGQQTYTRIATIPEKKRTWYEDYGAGLKDIWEYVVRQAIAVGGGEVPSYHSSVAEAALAIKSRFYLHDVTDPTRVYVMMQHDPSRSFRQKLDQEVALPWGAAKPVEHLGEGGWWTFQLEADWLVTEEARALLSQMLVDGNVLVYRDGRGRRLFCRPEEAGETDVLPAQYSEYVPMVEVAHEEAV